MRSGGGKGWVVVLVGRKHLLAEGREEEGGMRGKRGGGEEGRRGGGEEGRRGKRERKERRENGEEARRGMRKIYIYSLFLASLCGLLS